MKRILKRRRPPLFPVLLCRGWYSPLTAFSRASVMLRTPCRYPSGLAEEAPQKEGAISLSMRDRAVMSGILPSKP
ncbi:MAG: hypothetical protein BWY86_00975 [Candidatus Aminicenantes bacterium ADurb.Bin508]|nr:MAG: hypothetical protein BWY86_00975 [Candidatus Aminicenantes bacterium ADurb.Bin508]